MIPQKNSLRAKGIYYADHETFLREIYDAYEAARSTSSNCDGGFADRVPKRQPDLVTRMMLEHASSSSNGDYEQSTIFQLFLGCNDRAVNLITELVSIRVRFMHSEGNQTTSLRDVDPVAFNDARAIIDDGCNNGKLKHPMDFL